MKLLPLSNQLLYIVRGFRLDFFCPLYYGEVELNVL
jgi:hypothetical protein